MLEPIRDKRELTYSGCVNAFAGVPDVGVLRPPEQKGISPYRSQRQCSCKEFLQDPQMAGPVFLISRAEGSRFNMNDF